MINAGPRPARTADRDVFREDYSGTQEEHNVPIISLSKFASKF
jgi:hypothetical protein